MKPFIKIFYCLCFSCLLFIKIQAQEISLPKDSIGRKTEAKSKINFLKFNITGVALKNYTVQYERAFSRKFSFGLALRFMPNTSIPFKDKIIETIDVTDQDTKNTIKKLKISGFGISPEIRLYLSKKGYGRGFYIAPYCRYANFKIEDMLFTYENILNIKSTISLGGNFTNITGGLQIGTQWMLSKKLCLDWWIIGAHYGSGNGEFTGTSSKTLSPDEQADLRSQLNDIDVPYSNKTVLVNANGATIKLDGPWAGVKAGIAIGWRF